MYGRFAFLVFAVCLIQPSVAEEESDDQPCRPLSDQSASLACDNNGERIDCEKAPVGSTARFVFKKTVVRKKNVTEITCISPGVWRRSKPNAQPKGYKRIGDNKGLFKVSRIGALFDVADTVCMNDGARMMVVDTPEKVKLARDIISEKPHFPGAPLDTDIWAGISNQKNKDFETILGKPASSISFFNPGAGDPVPPNEYKCVLYSYNVKSLWIESCKTQSRGFVCEKDE